MSLKHFKKIFSLLLVAVMLVGTPGFELCTKTVQASEVDVITGFADFDIEWNAFYINIDDKPTTAEELAADMPKQLEVYLNGSSESVLIDVSWFEITGEYAETDYYYYQFSPSWDETKYVLSDSISLLEDAPYIAVHFMESGAATLSLEGETVQDKVFNYLINVGYSEAAACGIMANIEKESGFKSNNLQNSYESKLGYTDETYTEAVNNGTYSREDFQDSAGYGLCQWTFKTRKAGLYDYATGYFSNSEEFNIGDLEMQLGYLVKELTNDYSTVNNQIKEVPNTAQGAYNAAYLFCYYFEAPAGYETASIERGNLAQNTYWEKYGKEDSTASRVTLTGHEVPERLYVGDYFIVKGIVNSTVENLTSVKVSCVNMSGKEVIGYTKKSINSKSYNLNDLDNYIEFDTLKAGNYHYKIEATTASGTTVLEDAIFQVLEKEQNTSSSTSTIRYSAHVQSYGWQGYTSDGDTAGTTGQSKRIEAIKIDLCSEKYSGSVSYKSYVQDYGWLDWVQDDAVSGITGESKQLEAIRIELTGQIASHYDIYYRVHVQKIGWLDWAKNGEVAGTIGQSKQVEAIQITLVEKDTSAPGSTAVPAQLSSQLQYSGHSASIGWGAYVSEGETVGTTGKSLRLEAIKISLNEVAYDGSIKYSAHVQSYGWQDWVKNGALSGTTGEAKRMEAIRIQLSGEIEKYYDVYYRAHVQSYGWLDWAKNGDAAGTTGLGKQMEALQIVLVKKGSAAPGATTTPLITK